MTIKQAMANDTTAAMKDFPDSGAQRQEQGWAALRTLGQRMHFW